jgi:hypothetical protein
VLDAQFLLYHINSSQRYYPNQIMGEATAEKEPQNHIPRVLSATAENESGELMLALVRELTFANKKLETDLAETKRLLTNAQAEALRMKELAEEGTSNMPSPSVAHEIEIKKTIFGELEEYVMSTSLQRLGLSEAMEGKALSYLSDSDSQSSRRNGVRRIPRSNHSRLVRGKCLFFCLQTSSYVLCIL